VLLASAKVGPFKSINEPQVVEIDREVTVCVGMNEAGKTVFLQALEKSADGLSLAKFDPVEDYPGKDLPGYLKQHKTSPARVGGGSLHDRHRPARRDPYRQRPQLGCEPATQPFVVLVPVMLSPMLQPGPCGTSRIGPWTNFR
jgi:hypothetical protein